MIKNKLDFKLINILIISIICFLVYKTFDLWMILFTKLSKIILPILIGFVIAYALNPILNYFIKHKIPKCFGIFLIILFIIIIFISLVILLIPISNQLMNFINIVLDFINKLNIDLSKYDNIINKVFAYLSDGLFKTINTSINIITNFIISFISSIYFLIDMNKIRKFIKNKLKNKSIFNYIKIIDLEMKKYISGFIKIVFISFFEYTSFYYIINHPYALLLGILSSLANFIPYFGGMIVQILAVVTGLTISFNFGLKITILTLILGLFDSYIINPYVYGKSNELHPIIVIISVFAGGILFGFFGIMISIPLAIIIVNTLKYYDITKNNVNNF